MSDAPLVSVIIPCLNQAHFLGEAIESALSQDYPSVEVVVVDDGSTDHTAKVATATPEVHYVYQANAGLAAARNKGIAESHGSYLVFLDADDWLCAGGIRAGVDCIRRHPDSGFVYGRFRFVEYRGGPDVGFDPPPDNPDTYLGLFGGNHVAMCATVLCSRAVLDRVGGFRAELRASEDYDLYFRIARLYPYMRHDHLVAECRRHESNMSLNAALMLKSTLAVVQSQQPCLDTPELRIAYRRSLQIWREYYGDLTGRQIRTHLRRRNFRQAWADGLTLASYAPTIIPRAALRAVVPWRIRKRFERLGNEIARFLEPPSRRRLTPFSRDFGYDRGTPIDRYYIERFLEAHAEDIGGHVLEIKDNTYTVRFGGKRVLKSDVLDVDRTNPNATIIADLNCAAGIPDGTFDCIILTQTLQLIYDLRAAVRTLHRILKPGGVVLVTVPGISQIARDQLKRWKDYWRFTGDGASKLFEEVFDERNVSAEIYGNLSSAVSFLRGRAAEELSTGDLQFEDPDYPLVITIRARKG
jgi:glycosyltransferase involved in cell wall biosynthesis